jgi:hypothetical protein
MYNNSQVSHEQFVKDKTDADVSGLAHKDTILLCKFILAALSLEGPRIAKARAQDLGIEVDWS